MPSEGALLSPLTVGGGTQTDKTECLTQVEHPSLKSGDRCAEKSLPYYSDEALVASMACKLFGENTVFYVAEERT